MIPEPTSEAARPIFVVFRGLAGITPPRGAQVMHYVYLLQSAVDHRRHYTGCTQNLRARLTRHNAGQNQSTIHGRPWRLVGYFAFAAETKARDFERYLKSGSGKTFANRHLI